MKLILSLVTFAACVPDAPYSGPKCSAGTCQLDPAKTYVVNVTDGFLKSEADAIVFNVHRSRVIDAFDRAPGAIGASLRIRGLEIATVSIWEDEASLAAFTAGTAHANAEVELGPRLGSQFVAMHWNQLGSVLPITLDEALAKVHP